MDSVNVSRVLLCWVSPFGNLRIKAHLRLPEAYRSLSRPSSALSAKAFPLRPLQLNLSGRSSRIGCYITRIRKISVKFSYFCSRLISQSYPNNKRQNLDLFINKNNNCLTSSIVAFAFVILFSFQGAIIKAFNSSLSPKIAY